MCDIAQISLKNPKNAINIDISSFTHHTNSRTAFRILNFKLPFSLTLPAQPQNVKIEFLNPFSVLELAIKRMKSQRKMKFHCHILSLSGSARRNKAIESKDTRAPPKVYAFNETCPHHPLTNKMSLIRHHPHRSPRPLIN